MTTKISASFALGALAPLAIALLTQQIHAQRSAAPTEPEYVLVDATNGHVLDARWSDSTRAVPVGSLIKPFTALAYSGAHMDGCWLPHGHGEIGIVDAIAGSCNSYFRQLSQQTSPAAFISTLQWLGMSPDVTDLTAATMVGLGEGLRLTPSAVIHGYLELVSRASQPGISPIMRGMQVSARSGTGRAVGSAVGHLESLSKTGTAPCIHSRNAGADGYALVIYPADRPRVALLVRAHGRTGAEAAVAAGQLLTRALEAR